MGDVKRVKVEDRYRELPEEVISNILSRLNTRQAARTSVLSKHWRNYWTHVHSLNFFDWLALDKFVPQVLSRRRLYGLSKLSILFNGNCSNREVKEEIISLVYNYAISHHIQELDTDDIGSFQIGSLKTLRLRSGRLSDFHGFTSLTVLTLYKVTFLDSTRDDIFSKCLNLEKLVMDQCISEQGGLCISNPRLISLQIKQELFVQDRIAIKSPKLELCELDFIDPKILRIDDCPALDNVNINIGFESSPGGQLKPEFVNPGFSTLCDVKQGFNAHCDVKLCYSNFVFSMNLVKMCEEMSYARLLTMWLNSAGGTGSRILYKHDASAVHSSDVIAHLFAETLYAPDVRSRWGNCLLVFQK